MLNVRDTKQKNKTKQILLKKIGNITNTLLSQPQIAYELIEAGGAEDILQV